MKKKTNNKRVYHEREHFSIERINTWAGSIVKYLRLFLKLLKEQLKQNYQRRRKLMILEMTLANYMSLEKVEADSLA